MSAFEECQFNWLTQLWLIIFVDPFQFGQRARVGEDVENIIPSKIQINRTISGHDVITNTLFWLFIPHACQLCAMAATSWHSTPTIKSNIHINNGNISWIDIGYSYENWFLHSIIYIYVIKLLPTTPNSRITTTPNMMAYWYIYIRRLEQNININIRTHLIC